MSIDNPLIFLGFLALAFIIGLPFGIPRIAGTFRTPGTRPLFVVPSMHHFFMRTKGDRPHDFLGHFPEGVAFLRDMQPSRGRNDPQAWQVYDEDNYVLEDRNGNPIPFIHKEPWQYNVLLRPFMRWVNVFTNVVLVGFPGFFQISSYEIEKIRVQKVTKPEGQTMFVVVPPRVGELSNHNRTGPFQWVVFIPGSGAKSRDGVGWDILLTLQLRCINPWIARNRHESWSQFINATVIDAIVRCLRGMSTNEVLSLAGDQAVASEEARDRLALAVRNIQARIQETAGHVIDDSAAVDDEAMSGGVQILSIEPNLRTDADRDAFLQAWRAEQKAAEIRTTKAAEAEGEAGVYRETIAAIAEHGEVGEQALRYQSMVDAALGGKSTLLFDSGDGRGNAYGRLEQLLATVADRLNQQG